MSAHKSVQTSFEHIQVAHLVFLKKKIGYKSERIVGQLRASGIRA